MAERKIRAGYYRRYDGKLIYLVTAAEDAETGEETVILRSYSFSEVPQYFTLSKKSFCAFVEVNGERRSKYKRVTSMKITEAVISNLAEDGMRGPIRKKSAERDAEDEPRVYQSCAHLPCIRQRPLRELSFRFGQVSSLYEREAVRRHHPK